MTRTDDGIDLPEEPDRGRRVAGTVLILIGAGIAVQVVRAIAASRAATHAPWTAYVAGVLVFGGVALAFVLPGAGMFLYRRTVRIDLARREVIERTRWLGWWRTRSQPLARFTTIVLVRRVFQRSRSGSSSGGPKKGTAHPYFAVELAAAKGKPLRLVVDEKEEPARAAARELVAATGLRFDDAVARARERERTGQDDEEDDADDA